MNVTGTINVYDNFLLELARGNVKPESDSLVMGLSGSGYTPALSHTDIASIADELSGNGYVRQTLTGVVVSLDNGKAKIDCNDVQFSADGGDLTARYWWVFDDTHASDILVGYGLIDESDEDVTIIDGQPLSLVMNQNGLFRVGRV